MKDKSTIPYFFDKNKSGFSKSDFDTISPEKFHLYNDSLTDELQNNLFQYDNAQKNNIVFYYINAIIKKEEDLQNLHLRIFSEDKLLFMLLIEKKIIILF